MLRKPSLIAALSLACAFLAPNLFAQSVAPRRAITLSEPAPRDNGEYLIDENRVKLAEAAQKQDLDALANLLLEAERLQSDSNSLKLYAVAYYGALLESTDKKYKKLETIAKKSAKALRIDFATVDIIETEKEGLEVLEINSNVCLGNFGNRCQEYYDIAKAIYKKVFKKATK